MPMPITGRVLPLLPGLVVGLSQPNTLPESLLYSLLLVVASQLSGSIAVITALPLDQCNGKDATKALQKEGVNTAPAHGIPIIFTDLARGEAAQLVTTPDKKCILVSKHNTDRRFLEQSLAHEGYHAKLSVATSFRFAAPLTKEMETMHSIDLMAFGHLLNGFEHRLFFEKAIKDTGHSVGISALETFNKAKAIAYKPGWLFTIPGSKLRSTILEIYHIVIDVTHNTNIPKKQKKKFFKKLVNVLAKQKFEEKICTKEQATRIIEQIHKLINLMPRKYDSFIEKSLKKKRILAASTVTMLRNTIEVIAETTAKALEIRWEKTPSVTVKYNNDIGCYLVKYHLDEHRDHTEL